MTRTDSNLRGSIKNEQKRYRSFLYFGGTFFLLLLVVGVVLKVQYSAPTAALISEAADEILFELTIIIAGTGFGSAVIGVIIDQYQQRFSDRQETVSEFIIQEGIVDVFRSATDPRLIQYLLDIIPKARSEIICTGLGLGILSHNHEILRAMANRLNSVRSLKIGIGSSNRNDG